jgi:hypothetical protein
MTEDARLLPVEAIVTAEGVLVLVNQVRSPWFSVVGEPV